MLPRNGFLIFLDVILGVNSMQTLATNNKALAQQLLQGYTQLPKAIFQVCVLSQICMPYICSFNRSATYRRNYCPPSYMFGDY